AKSRFAKIRLDTARRASENVTMSYTVIVGGVPVQCETAAEALELARQAGGDSGHAHAHRHAPEKNGVPGSRWTEERIKSFFRVIKAQQRKLIEALLETTDGRTDEQLCQVLGLKDGRALAGVFTGLFKNAKKVGANP